MRKTVTAKPKKAPRGVHLESTPSGTQVVKIDGKTYGGVSDTGWYSKQTRYAFVRVELSKADQRRMLESMVLEASKMP